MLDGTPTDRESTTPAARISTAIVGLFKEYYGRGPQQTKTYIHDDLVVVLMRGGFTRVEETLLDAGHGAEVIAQRTVFADLMRDRFSAVVEAETGRTVVAFMNASHQRPDVLAELFVLGPSAEG